MQGYMGAMGDSENRGPKYSILGLGFRVLCMNSRILIIRTSHSTPLMSESPTCSSRSRRGQEILPKDTDLRKKPRP